MLKLLKLLVCEPVPKGVENPWLDYVLNYLVQHTADTESFIRLICKIFVFLFVTVNFEQLYLIFHAWKLDLIRLFGSLLLWWLFKSVKFRSISSIKFNLIPFQEQPIHGSTSTSHTLKLHVQLIREIYHINLLEYTVRKIFWWYLNIYVTWFVNVTYSNVRISFDSSKCIRMESFSSCLTTLILPFTFIQ